MKTTHDSTIRLYKPQSLEAKCIGPPWKWKINWPKHVQFPIMWLHQGCVTVISQTIMIQFNLTKIMSQRPAIRLGERWHKGEKRKKPATSNRWESHLMSQSWDQVEEVMDFLWSFKGVKSQCNVWRKYYNSPASGKFGPPCCYKTVEWLGSGWHTSSSRSLLPTNRGRKYNSPADG